MISKEWVRIRGYPLSEVWSNKFLPKSKRKNSWIFGYPPHQHFIKKEKLNQHFSPQQNVFWAYVMSGIFLNRLRGYMPLKWITFCQKELKGKGGTPLTDQINFPLIFSPASCQSTHYDKVSFEFKKSVPPAKKLIPRPILTINSPKSPGMD